MAIWIGHTLHRNYLLKHVIEGKLEGTGRWEIRRKQLLDDVKGKTEYTGIWNRKHEIALSGEIALKEPMDLWQERLRDDHDIKHYYIYHALSCHYEMHTDLILYNYKFYSFTLYITGISTAVFLNLCETAAR